MASQVFTVLSTLLIAAASPPTGLPRPAIPPARLDDTLEITGEGVKARQIRTRMFVPVMVDGQGPFRFLVDSGADRSVVGAALAARLGLIAEGPTAILQSMAGPSKVQTVRLDTLRIGPSTIAGIHAPVLVEADLGADGLLGIDAMADQRLLLDFEAKTVTVQDRRRPEAAGSSSDDEIVVTARRRKGQLILTQARAGIVRVSAVIDTGAEMSVGNSALRALVFRGSHPPEMQTISLMSVTGQAFTAEIGVLPEITIGRVTLERVPIAFVDVPPFALFGLAHEPALLLGTDVLDSFRRVGLDFRERRVRFVLRRH